MICRLKNGVVGTAVAMAFILLAAGTTAAQDIKTNYMPGTDFSRFKTYKWVAIQGVEQPDQILDQQIKQAIDAQLVLKGMTKTGDDKADLYVGYQLSITHEQQWNAYGTGGGWRMSGAWLPSRVPRFKLAHWGSISTIRRRKSCSGEVKQPRP